MAILTIKNIGPIKDVTLELNKVNVIMGPQCSGKSTIAKIISFCTWLEKKLTRGGAFCNEFNNVWLCKLLQTYHRLNNGYFSDKSVIEYEGEYINYSFKGQKSPSTGKENIKYKEVKKIYGSKIIYIPSERNFVSIMTDLEQYAKRSDNIQDFIINWFEAKRTFGEDNKLSILNLGIEYNSDSFDNDFITQDNGVKLKLQTASSGLQSVVPLLALFDYISTDMYGKSRPMSVQERDALIGKYNEMVKRKKESEGAIDSNDLEMLLDLILSKNYTNSQFIIEEPEQNLFPSTQRDLVYHLLKLITADRDHRLTVTTHSPYILYALNNCMLGYLVNSQLQEEEKKEFLSKNFLSQNSWINPESVSIWEIEDGKLRNIQDKDNIISENYFDIKMTELTDEYYQMFNYYKDEE